MATPGDLSNIVDVPMDKIRLVPTEMMTDQDDWYVATGLDHAAVARMRSFQRETQPIISPDDLVVFYHPAQELQFRKAFNNYEPWKLKRKEKIFAAIYKRKPDLPKRIDIIRRIGGDFEEQFLEVRKCLKK